MSQYFEWLKSARTTLLAPAGTDFLRSLPDSLFVGTGVFALLTQSFPLGILVFAMVEFTIVHRLLGGFLSAISPTITKPPANYLCHPGIPSPYQLSAVGALLSDIAVPSGPMFFVAAVITYCLGAVMNFSKELKELSKKESQWGTRIPLGATFGGLLLAVYMVWRYMSGCDSVPVILGSTLVGMLAGMSALLIHLFLFGRFSINFLGIPLLADRVSEGRPLYVCAKTSKTQ